MSDKPINRPYATGGVLDRLSARFFEIDKPRDAKDKPSDKKRTPTTLVIKSLPLLASAFLIGAFIYAQNFYYYTFQRMEAHPLVVNATKEAPKTKVRFGVSPKCGEVDCWVERDSHDSDWHEVTLPLSPNANITTLPGYDAGLGDGWMYYRIILPIPEKLQKLDEEISFTPLFIAHQTFEVYVNGRLTYVGNGVGSSRIANFPLPKKDVIDGKVLVTIKASVRPGDAGIAHYLSMLVGPKSVLDNAYLFTERSMYTFYLLFLLTKGSIFVVSALFFFYTRGQPGFIYFLVFAFFITVENLFIGYFLVSELDLNLRVLGFYGCKTLAYAGLGGFLVNFYDARKLRRASFLMASVASLITFVMAYDFGWGSRTITYSHLWHYTNAILITVVTFGVVIGALAIRLWRSRGAGGERLKTYIGFTIFLLIYLALIVDELYFKISSHYDKAALYDLAFFFGLALISARDMGRKEGRIETLESHMEEKRRMELELQEAAEIARAFIPSAAPSWPSIAVGACHKPLTENSGDWYAFEASADKKLFHCVMCDITGHGVQAAIVVSTCKSILSSILNTTPQLLSEHDFLLRFMQDLNATLWSNGKGFHVSTLLGLTFEPEKERVLYISAGHPAPLYLPGDGPQGRRRPKALVSRHTVLGIRPEVQGELKEHPFRPGDQLIAFTDGLPVGSNLKALQEFLQVQEDLNDTPDEAAEKLCKRIWDAETNRTGQARNDDVSIVWFKGLLPAEDVRQTG